MNLKRMQAIEESDLLESIYQCKLFTLPQTDDLISQSGLTIRGDILSAYDDQPSLHFTFS